MDEPITKRLIISGLTPSITAEDISRRLTTFGTVKAADGFGLPDGLGNPRSFGYVTLDTTVGKLAKCMNLLSGSTWKGAKLRFGEAKPDFRERIVLENKKAAEEPPKKKRKRFGAAEAEDMTLVLPENVAERSGWKVSSLGRITKPVKMRPTHPLPEIIEEKSKTSAGVVKFSDIKKSGEVGERKKKKRVKDTDTRARRKVIDMTKYGSTHLKSMFLDLDVPMPTTLPERYKDKRPENEEIESVADSDDSDNYGPPAKAVKPIPQLISPPKKNDVMPIAGRSASNAKLPTMSPIPEATLSPISTSVPVPIPTYAATTPPAPKAKPAKYVTHPVTLPSNSTSSTLPDNYVDIQQEKAQSLNLLNSLFGGKDDDDWVGQEDVDSDIDISELVKGDRMLVDDEEPDFEVVSVDAPLKQVLSVPSPDESESEEEEEEVTEQDDKIDTNQRTKFVPEETNATISKPKTLKDLFAPREEEAEFSLLGHLDLDIELDEDPLTAEPTAPQQPELSETYTAPQPTTITLQTHPSQAPLVLDPRQALFFPLPRQEGGNSIRARQRDVFDLSKDNGWNWRNPAVGFYQTGAEEDIRKRWEESKGELTRDWKRRCREAGKVNRRKRGGVEGDDEY